MQRFQKSVLVLTAVALALLLLGPAPVARARTTSLLGLLTATDDPAGAVQLLELVNADRAAAGLGVLQPQADLTAIAQGQSRLMAGVGSIWHNDGLFTSSIRQGLDAVVLGENVAFDSGGVTHIHWMLMNSPHHRDNILDPRFNVAGFAITVSDGVAYVTEDFAQVRAATTAPAPPPPPTPAPAPAPAAPPPPPPAPAPAAPAPAPAAPAPAPAPPTTTAPPAADAPAARPPAPVVAAADTAPAAARSVDGASAYRGPTDSAGVTPVVALALGAVNLCLAALAGRARRQARRALSAG
jgi:uncharacterized protein YkwD